MKNKKSNEVQLETAKMMIKAHYESHVKSLERGKEGSMMCMFISKDGRDTNNTNKKGTYKCDHCGKVDTLRSVKANLFAELLWQS